jgi:hypothetical protein
LRKPCCLTYPFSELRSLFSRAVTSISLLWGSVRQQPMYRLSASVLLVMTLTGIFSPVALGLSLPSQHACCLRKAPRCHDGEPQAQSSLSSGGCAQHSCCRSLGVRQWAQSALPAVSAGSANCFGFDRPTELPLVRFSAADVHSCRAPPFSLSA